MTEKKFPPSKSFASNSHIGSIKLYKKLYQESIEDPEKFWSEKAERLKWTEKWDSVREFDFVEGKISWFNNGKLNVSQNCLDRHVEAGNGNRKAIIWEGNNPGEEKTFTYSELLSQVQRFANVLINNGIKKGDRVCIYLQMVPELAIAMLACSRIGAVHSIVFGAFSADSLRDRINDSSCKILITQDTGVRGTKTNISMKAKADNAVDQTPSIEKVIVVKRTGAEVIFKNAISSTLKG